MKKKKIEVVFWELPHKKQSQLVKKLKYFKNKRKNKK
jgi:hypothetical protein